MHGNASGCMQHHVPRKAIWKYLRARLTTRASLDQPIIAAVAACPHHSAASGRNRCRVAEPGGSVPSRLSACSAPDEVTSDGWSGPARSGPPTVLGTDNVSVLRTSIQFIFFPFFNFSFPKASHFPCLPPPAHGQHPPGLCMPYQRIFIGSFVISG